MRTRKVGEVTFTTGETPPLAKYVEWEGSQTGLRETQSVQVFSRSGNGTWESSVYGYVDADKVAPGPALTSIIVGDRIHQDVPIMPYHTVAVNMTAAPTGADETVEVWVVE